MTADDRVVIEPLLADGLSLRAVSARVGCHASTICRERERGRLAGFDRNLSVMGQRTREAARARGGLARCKQRWSPQQSAGRLRSMPGAPSISHETIYAAIYAMPRGALRAELIRCLRKSHAGRLTRARGSSRFSGVQNMTPIGLRPVEVNSRQVPGHWEADLIKGTAMAQPRAR